MIKKSIISWLIAISICPGLSASAAILDACQDGNLEAVKSLIEANPAVVNPINHYSTTPLHAAAQLGHTEIATLLMQNGANVNAKNTFGETPLHMAALCGCTKTAALLIQNGADISAKDRKGNTPLHTAIQGDDIDVATLLIDKGADVNAKNMKNKTPLNYVEKNLAQPQNESIKKKLEELKKLIAPKTPTPNNKKKVLSGSCFISGLLALAYDIYNYQQKLSNKQPDKQNENNPTETNPNKQNESDPIDTNKEAIKDVSKNVTKTSYVHSIWENPEDHLSFFGSIACLGLATLTYVK